MPGIKEVSFTSPYSAEEADIARRRQLAELLQQQGQQPLGGTEMVGGWAIPKSPWEGAGKMAQQISGAYQQKKLTEQEQDLAKRYQRETGETLAKAMRQLQGSPAQENPGSELSPGWTTPAQAPDPMGAMTSAVGNPMASAIVNPLAMQQYQRQELVKALSGGQGAQQQPQGAPQQPGMPQAGGQPPAGPQSAVGGPAGGVPMAAWIQADPSGKAYMEQLAKDQAAISTRYGIFQKNLQTGNFDPKGGALPQGAMPYQFGPNGQVDVSPYPGQVAGAASLAGAQAAAKVPYENVTTAGGATMPAYMAPGFKPPPMPAQAPQPQPKITGEAPTDAAALQAVQLASSRGQPATISGPDPWSTMPKRQIPQGIGQTTFDKGLQEHQATKASELSTKYGELADHANQRIALNNQALSLVDKADTGPMAAQVGTVKNWLVSNLGISEDRFSNTPSATIALQKDLLNAATQKAKQQFGSRMTQSEVLLMLSKGSPNVDMPKAAIKYLIGTDNATAQYQIKQANDLGQYLQKGGDPMRFDSWYSQTFPLTGAVDKVHLNTGANSSAQEIADEMRRRGLIK